MSGITEEQKKLALNRELLRKFHINDNVVVTKTEGNGTGGTIVTTRIGVIARFAFDADGYVCLHIAEPVPWVGWAKDTRAGREQIFHAYLTRNNTTVEIA